MWLLRCIELSGSLEPGNCLCYVLTSCTVQLGDCSHALLGTSPARPSSALHVRAWTRNRVARMASGHGDIRWHGALQFTVVLSSVISEQVSECRASPNRARYLRYSCQSLWHCAALLENSPLTTPLFFNMFIAGQLTDGRFGSVRKVRHSGQL